MSEVQSPAAVEADASSNDSNFFESGTIIDANDKVQEEVREALSAEEQSSEPEKEKQNDEQKPENEEKKKEDPLSQKFAALSRKEKQLRLREKELEKRLADLEAQIKPQAKTEESKVEEKIDYETLSRKNPLEALKKLGLADMNKLAELMLNDGKLPIETQLQLMQEEMDAKLQAKMAEIEKKQTERDEEVQKKKDAQIIENYKKDLNDFIAQNNEKYEFIVTTGNEELVYDVILQRFEEDGVELSKEEAADLVEAHLEEEAKKVFEKTNKAKKIMGASNSTQAKQETPQSSKPKSSPTLTNEAGSEIPTSKKPYLSDEDLVREAAKLMKWE